MPHAHHTNLSHHNHNRNLKSSQLFSLFAAATWHGAAADSTSDWLMDSVSSLCLVACGLCSGEPVHHPKVVLVLIKTMLRGTDDAT